MNIALAVPSLDQGRFLPHALDSILGQEGVQVSVALLDAGSRDGTDDVIRGYAGRLAYWRSRPDAGQAAAINEGIAALPAADCVGWLNADDFLLPGSLRAMAEHLAAHPDRVAVYGEGLIADAAGGVAGRFPTRPFTRRALAAGSIVCQPASLVRRAAWEAVGGLDESLHMVMDYDLWWKLSALGPIGYLPEPLACSRDHPETKTRGQQDRMYREAFDVLRRRAGYVPLRWCASEAAFGWRAGHGGRRAAGLAWIACGWRAARRYAGVNGLAGMAGEAADVWRALAARPPDGAAPGALHGRAR